MIRVALIDSGVAPRHAVRLAAARAFRLESDEAGAGSAGARVFGEDGVDAVTCGALAHGAALADVLLEDARVELLAARVFFGSLTTSPAQLAAALDWAVANGARLASISAGLRDDREVLGGALARARASAVLVVAASPARGAPVYPAAYPGVVRATGDARCAPGEWSWLASAQADFAGHACAGDVRGASAGCARIAARLAALLADGATPERALQQLRAGARYRGPERRSE